MAYDSRSLKTSERGLSAMLAFCVPVALLSAVVSIKGPGTEDRSESETLATFSVLPPQAEQSPDSEVARPAARKPEPKAVPPETKPPVPARVLPTRSVRLPDLRMLAASEVRPLPLSMNAAGLPAAGRAEAEGSRQAEPAFEPGRQETAGAASGQGEEDGYARAVFREIRREQSYDEVLQRGRLEGTVILAFTIDRRGRLRQSRVAQTSGHPAIDRLALAQLEEAAPFPRPPQGRERSFRMPLTYRQRD